MAVDVGKRKRSFELDESDDDINPRSTKRIANSDEDSNGTWAISQHMKKFFQWMTDAPLNRFVDSTLNAIGLRHPEPNSKAGRGFEQNHDDIDNMEEEEINLAFPMPSERGKLNKKTIYERFPLRKHKFVTLGRCPMSGRSTDEAPNRHHQKKLGKNGQHERILFSSLPNRSSHNLAQNYDFIYSSKSVSLTDKFNSSNRVKSPFSSSHNKQHLPTSTPTQEHIKFRTLLVNTTSKSDSESSRKQPTSLPKIYFTTNEVVRMQEKEQYRMLVERYSQNDMFCHKECVKENVVSLLNKQITDTNNKFSKQVNEVSNTKLSYCLDQLAGNDEPIVLKYKPRSCQLPASTLQNSRLYSSEWIQEFKKMLIERTEETRERETQINDFERKRAEKFAKLKKYVSERKKISLEADVLEIVSLEKEFVLPELTPEMNKVIDEALMPKSPNEVVARYSNLTVLYKDIETLCGLNWLNDEIINTYMFLIEERSKLPDYPSVYVFNSFFYPRLKNGGHVAVKRWTRKKDIFGYDINLVPLHLGVHWCLAVIDHRYKKIQYYDSMNGKENCLPILKQYLICESQDKKQKELDTTGWTLEAVKDIPPQLNGSDCGMFTLKYAEFITRNAVITFNQQHMQYFRRKMVYEIVIGQLV